MFLIMYEKIKGQTFIFVKCVIMLNKWTEVLVISIRYAY